ncbi:hypothetical protein [Endozoicomonas sp. SESOKO1]|uniref:hypothetical protein n=1 Tax=Endozoicomonas sp. SESOKO1 TaxID=2828742 RepID=UPI0021480F84|nr:hypothetical protein [Endozoicomonas sp. SESOKO1]
MAIDLKHWLLKSAYTSDEAALLFVGVESYDVNLNVNNALYAKIPYAEKAAVISQVLHEKFVEDHDWENIPTIPKEDILSFAEENQLAFPYENAFSLRRKPFTFSSNALSK